MTPFIQHLQARANLLAATRAFFSERNVLETTTSVLSRAAVTDPAIESFSVPVDAGLSGRSTTAHVGLSDSPSQRYLRTSPEFALKRLLVEGAGDVYEIGPVFRQGESGPKHNPEFTLLEWYRCGYSMQQLIDEVAGYLHETASPDFRKLTVRQIRYFDAFEEALGQNVSQCNAQQLKKIAEDLGRPPRVEMDRDQWLDYLMGAHVQPKLANEPLVVLTHYPASQAALASLASDGATALRFEVFVSGLELANGFEELLDPHEQRQRFVSDNQLRQARGQATMPIDEAFLGALERGMPACSGVALGIDRWLMCLQDEQNISALLTWPWHDS